ncbi:MAG: FHA domain-containing protein, partial [Selenomonadaceae bacterium]|nr:FHA domain-containing protein [Selenomonadaceae bacterium]
MPQNLFLPENFAILGKGGEKNDCLFPLPNRAIGIGTDPNSCSIVYFNSTNSGVEAFHCQLVPQENFWTLTDFSKTGTWLNGQKINPYQPYPLKIGDTIYIASTENTFVFCEYNPPVQKNLPPVQNPVTVNPPPPPNPPPP